MPMPVSHGQYLRKTSITRLMVSSASLCSALLSAVSASQLYHTPAHLSPSPQAVAVAAPQATQNYYPRLKVEEDVRVEEVRGGGVGGAGRRSRRARVVRVR